MDFKERFQQAKRDYHDRTKKYYEMLFRIEMSKLTRTLLFDTVNKTIIEISSPKTDYEIWLEKRIEEIRVEVFAHWIII